jgi:hypothetical protein
MDYDKNNLSIWLFRFITLLACISVIYSFTRPWWICYFGVGKGNFISIYGWGLRENLKSLSSFVANDVTPQWQINVAWVTIGISCILALLSTWIKKLGGVLLMGLTGAGLIAYPIVTIHIVIAHRLLFFKIALQGPSTVQGMVQVSAHLTNWHYLTLIGGALLIILALFRQLSKYHF